LKGGFLLLFLKKTKAMFNLHKKYFLFLFLFYFSIKLTAQTLSNVRIGMGVGSSIYWGTQMDYDFKLNTFGINEINRGYNFQTYFAFDKKQEIGIRFLNTELWSFKSNNTLALNAKVDEFSLIYQRSLNNNIDLKSKDKFTYNIVLGTGIIYYRSIFYLVNTESGELTPFSSVGKGDLKVSSNLKVIQQIPTVSGLVGFNIGFRISNKFSIYQENTFTLSGSNKITGNLLLRSEIPNNGYTYHSFTLFYNISSKYNQLNCPKF
jgi:hypothetical protein